MLYKADTTVYGIQIVLHLNSAVQIASVYNPGVNLKRLPQGKIAALAKLCINARFKVYRFQGPAPVSSGMRMDS